MVAHKFCCFAKRKMNPGSLAIEPSVHRPMNMGSSPHEPSVHPPTNIGFIYMSVFLPNSADLADC